MAGTVKASNYAEHEEYRINAAFALITAQGTLVRRTMAQGSCGFMPQAPGRARLVRRRKRNLLDVARFLKFAVNKCGADTKMAAPAEADDLKELIGHRQTAPKPTVPIKPEELITLLNGLESDPSLRLAVGLVALFGLRPAELMVLSVDDRQPKGRQRQAERSQLSNTQATIDCSGAASEGTRKAKGVGWCSSFTPAW